MDDNWVKVYSAPEFLKVELAKNLLKNAEIESYIMDRQDSAYVVLGEVHLYVPQANAKQAAQLLQEQEF